MSSITNPHTHTSLTRTIPSHILVSQPANPTHTLNPSAYSLTSPPPPPLSLCIAFILHFYPPPHPRCLPYTLSVIITFHPFPQHHFLPTYHFTPSPHTLNPSAIVLLLHPCSSFIPCFTLAPPHPRCLPYTLSITITFHPLTHPLTVSPFYLLCSLPHLLTLISTPSHSPQAVR